MHSSWLSNPGGVLENGGVLLLGHPLVASDAGVNDHALQLRVRQTQLQVLLRRGNTDITEPSVGWC